MRHYKNIENGYILGIGKGAGGKEISAKEYNEILSVIHSKPEAEAGYDYKLKEDSTWELVEVPTIDPAEDEIGDEEALNIILGGGV